MMFNKRKISLHSESPNISQASTQSLGDTEEGIRQRRFDSLSRLLSLGSKHSACTAVTIHENELIVAANCAESESSLHIAQLMSQRIAVLREILTKITDEHLPVTPDTAEQVYASEMEQLKAYGGFFQRKTVIAQALYKLAKSILGKNALTVDSLGFTPEEIHVLMDSDQITILVPGETEEETIDTFTEQNSFAFSDASSFSIIPGSSTQSPINAASVSKLSFNLSHNNPSDNDYNNIWAFADDIDSDTDYDASENNQLFDTLVTASSQPIENFLLTSFEESCRITSASDHSRSQHYGMRYAMNVYSHDRLQQKVDFPESIYTNQPRLNISGFHAEQLIAYYLNQLKNVDLNDTHAQPIPFGISKLCCAACTTLYNFSRIKIRGSSFNNFNGVPNILSALSSSSVIHESSFNSPPPKNAKTQRTADPSPFWSSTKVDTRTEDAEKPLALYS